MAVRGFKGLGWFLCGAVVAPACYMVNSYGASEQAKLNAVKSAILEAKKDIRGLETEFDTRANFAQLQRWNETFALAAPAPQQFASETALADLDKATGATVDVASLVVPAGAPSAQVQPAVATAAVEPLPHAQPSVTGKSAIQQDRELRDLMKKADRKAMAMADTGLLSASTMDDLQKLAQREKRSLR